MVHDHVRSVHDRRRGRWLLATAAVAAFLTLTASSCVLNGAWTATGPLSMAPGSNQGLLDVSCPTHDFCMAIGEAASSSIAPIQSWNGSTWTAVPFDPQVPPDPYTDEFAVHDVSCATPTLCAIVWVHPFDYGNHPRVSVWNGSTWTTDEHLNDYAYSDDVVCNEDGSCVAVIQGTGTVVWDGDSFQTFSPPYGYGPVDALTCTAIDHCIRIANDRYGLWNGSTWSSPSPMPETTDIQSSWWSSIDCVASDRCVAVGVTQATLPLHPIAARFDGTAWTTTPMPMVGGNIQSLSCSSWVACVATGLQFSPFHQIAFAWNGGNWYRMADPPLPPAAIFVAISCAVGDRCMAVGNQGYGPALASTYAWQPVS